MNLIWGAKSKDSTKNNGSQTAQAQYVKAEDERIYFYADVDESSILELTKNLRAISHNLIAEAAPHSVPPAPAPIEFRISSFGGSLLHGLAGLDVLRQCQTRVPVYTFVDGCCASAATLLAIAGSRRFIGKNSVMLIHQLSGCAWGKYEELKDDEKNWDRMMEILRSVYLQYTKIPAGKLDEILKHDLWFTAAECLSYGMVDELI